MNYLTLFCYFGHYTFTRYKNDRLKHVKFRVNIKMDERRTFTNETGIYYLYRDNQQRTTQQVTFVSRMCHNFVARDDYNLSFVTCNHYHNVSLNYVYIQILIGEESKMWLPD